MSNFTDFVGGSGGAGTLPPIVFAESTTWSPAFDMEAVVYVVGGGGSGAASGQGSIPTGGAAGGVSISYLTLSPSTTYTVTVGAKGNKVGATTFLNGNVGGNSSFSGSGITTMTANGGGGGVWQGATPPSGGTASGGNLENNTGGTSIATTSSYSGGGACGFGGTGNNGELLPSTHSLNSYSSVCGGSLVYSHVYGYGYDNYNRETSTVAVGFNPLLGFDLTVNGRVFGDDTSNYFFDTPIIGVSAHGVGLDEHIGISGAFAGGVSASKNAGDCMAGSASVGGGGGCAYMWGGNGTDDVATSGDGGIGIVIIVPVVKLS